jgi:sulfur-oxidizing protein SoxX
MCHLRRTETVNQMNKLFMTTLLSMLLSLSVGCTPSAKSEFGFRLPDGDAAMGRETFAYMQCNQCHTVVGETFAAIPLADPPYVELGGNLSRIKTYGELVTAIINPSHKLAAGYEADVVSEDGESNMYVYNGYMTVQELIDLVSFLQSSYHVVPPVYQYRVYP